MHPVTLVENRSLFCFPLWGQRVSDPTEIARRDGEIMFSCNDRPLSPLFYIVYIGKDRRYETISGLNADRGSECEMLSVLVSDQVSQ